MLNTLIVRALSLDILKLRKNELHMIKGLNNIEYITKHLRSLGYTMFSYTGIHYPQRFNCFTLSMTLGSYNTKKRIMALTTTSDHVRTISTIFPSALWSEREIFDMFGVVFLGHPDQRRILTDYSFKGFPLLKHFSLMGYKAKAYCTMGKNIKTIDLVTPNSLVSHPHYIPKK